MGVPGGKRSTGGLAGVCQTNDAHIGGAGLTRRPSRSGLGAPLLFAASVGHCLLKPENYWKKKEALLYGVNYVYVVGGRHVVQKREDQS